MFIIDFDDTLFDTQTFKQARLEAVQRLGVSEKEYWETYRIARNTSEGSLTYTNERHAEVLSEYGYNKNEVSQMLKETTGEAVKVFLFEDAISFLENKKKLNQPMILLSLGNPGFQTLKTDGSGVNKYFDRVIFVHDTKKQVLEELLQNISDEEIWFINDKIEETQKLKIVFPWLRPILKASKRFHLSEYKESGLPYFENLVEIEEYVKKNLI